MLIMIYYLLFAIWIAAGFLANKIILIWLGIFFLLICFICILRKNDEINFYKDAANKNQEKEYCIKRDQEFPKNTTED